jgi:hypothetical protein
MVGRASSTPLVSPQRLRSRRRPGDEPDIPCVQRAVNQSLHLVGSMEEADHVAGKPSFCAAPKGSASIAGVLD